MSLHRPDFLPEVSASEAEDSPTVGLEPGPWLSPAEPASRAGGPTIPTFLPGERAADRFRIVRLVGQGGMGQVFEAFDEELSTRVALKVIRPEISGDPRAMALFRQEIQLAREVTHPNVCRIFDLFLEEPKAAAWGTRRQATRFLTMEFLEGESLRQRLRSSTAPAAEEVETWIRQLVDGLIAMHGAGITHRDLKPENVLLTPQDFGLRPVITDFGLAVAGRGSVAGAQSPTAGTPAYAAPEQQAGEAPTPAADIYSFGLILLELLEASAGRAQPARLEAPQRLDERLARLRAPWPRILRGCLEEDPARRISDALELGRILRPRRPLGPWLAAAVLVSSLGAGSALWLAGSPSQGSPGSENAEDFPAQDLPQEPPIEARVQGVRPTLLLLPARAPEEDGWLGELLRSALGALLEPRLDIRLLSSPLVAEAFPRRALEAEADRLLELRLLPGESASSRWVEWSYRGEEGEVSREGKAILSLPLDLDGLSGVAEGLLTAANLPMGPGEDLLPAALSGFPDSPKALEILARARRELQLGRPGESLELLNQLDLLEPDSREAAMTRARASEVLGHDRWSAAATERAFRLAAVAPQEVRDRLEAETFAARGQWPRAVRAYEDLWARYPDEATYGLALGKAQVVGLGVRQASESVKQLRSGSMSPGERLETLLLEARIARQMGEWSRQRALASQLVRESEDLGIFPLTLRGLFLEAEALRRAGKREELEEVQERFRRQLRAGRWSELDAVEVLLEFSVFGGLHQALHSEAAQLKAEEVFARNGQLRSLARLKILRALKLRSAPETRGEASRLAQEGLALAQEAKSPLALAEAHRALGMILHLESDNSGSAQHFSAAVDAAREVGDIVILGGFLYNYALVLNRLGGLRQAQERLVEAEALFRASGEQRGRVMALLLSGTLLSELGDLDAAQKLLEEARREAPVLPSPAFQAMAHERLGDLFQLRGRPEEAREAFARALEVWETLGPTVGDRIRLHFLVQKLEESTLHIEDSPPPGLLASLQTETRRLLERDQQAPGSYFHVLARIVLAEILTRHGRLEEARELLHFEGAAAVQARESALVFEAARTRALLLTAEGRAEEAIGLLQEQITEAQAQGSLRRQLELRLRLAEILHRTGRSDTAATQLESIRRLAAEAGYRAIEQRARHI